MLENKLLNFLRLAPGDDEIIDLCGWLSRNGIANLVFQDKGGNRTKSEDWPADIREWIDDAR